MAERPEIFISATSRDLKSCRQLVRDALFTLGCVPIVQDHFPPDARTVREMLREKIAACDAVLHIVGECYGFEPQERGASGSRRSYTQMEYDAARELGKPLYTFLCVPGFPYDAHVPEDDERRALQDKHRAAIQGADYIYVPVRDLAELDRSVRELQTRVEHLGRELHRARSWLARGLAVAVAVLCFGAGLLLLLQRRAGDIERQNNALQQQTQAQQQQLASLQTQLQQQTQLIALVSEKIDRSGSFAEGTDPAAAAQAAVARERGISVDELKTRLTGEGADLRQLLVRIDQRAAASEAQTAEWKKLKGAALTRLGDSEYVAGHYRDAIEPYRRALALHDENTEPLAWCDAAQKFEVALEYQGRFAEAEPLARQVVDRRTALEGADSRETLQAVSNLANILRDVNNDAAAEPLFRRVLEAQERTLGAEHPDTLRSVNGVANVLCDRGDYTGAEPLYRRCLEARERTLGKENRDTLKSVNNLANLLKAKGDYDGAESLYRRALEAQERTLGAEHPETLASVNNLANTLAARNGFAEAEGLYRRCLEARERTLGKEHPDTLGSVNNLANLMLIRGEPAAAEPLFRRCLEAREHALGKDAPDTLATLSNLAQAVDATGNFTAAEPLYLRAEEGMERALPPGHPLRLDLDHYFSLMREKQGRRDEALKLAEHAVTGARQTLPEISPDRRTYEQHLQELRAKAGR